MKNLEQLLCRMTPEFFSIVVSLSSTDIVEDKNGHENDADVFHCKHNAEKDNTFVCIILPFPIAKEETTSYFVSYNENT